MSHRLSTLSAILISSTLCADAALTLRDYTSNGTDFTGVDATGAFLWGMDVNPINNVANVDVDANGVKDFHELGTTPVDPSDGLASNTDGFLFRWDYTGSPSRVAGVETNNMSYTIEFAIDINSTGTEGSDGVFGIAARFTDSTSHGRTQLEIGRDGLSFTGGVAANTVLTTEAVTQSNLGYHTWRITYDADDTLMYFFRDGVLLNQGGVGIAGATNLGSPSNTYIGNYSSRLGGDWDLDYIALDSTGAFAPVPEPSSLALLCLGGLALLRRRAK